MKQEIFESYIGTVCERFSIKESKELFTKNKRRDVVDARHVLYYMCHKRPMRIRYIQQYMLDKGYDISHSSIIHGIKQVTRFVENDNDYRALIQELESNVLQS
ncbi:MAG TPA: hypothetical protein EYO58_06015 [Flavobacteriales bacterium]|nr:hypothetical protein [Flavobacteriales bacterium]